MEARLAIAGICLLSASDPCRGGEGEVPDVPWPMETLERPPARALKTLAMDNCIGCHEKSQYANEKGAGVVRTEARHVSTDCYTCHR